MQIVYFVWSVKNGTFTSNTFVFITAKLSKENNKRIFIFIFVVF